MAMWQECVMKQSKRLSIIAVLALFMKATQLNRYWRDVQASSMHYAFNLDMLGEMFGKLELGIST